MKIKTKKLRESAIIPTRGSRYAAGIDLYANFETAETLAIEPGENRGIPTGIAIEIPSGYYGAIFARSGIATKYGLRPANCVGVIDADYRGEVKVVLYNDSPVIQTVKNGERIAQLVIMPYLPVELIEADELSETVRGSGGFGSTGEGKV